MDDKDKSDTDTGSTGTGTAGSALGGAVAGAVAGTALGVPVVGTVIGALSGAAIGAARKRTTPKAKAAPKRKLNGGEAIGKTKSCVEERPQSSQEAAAKRTAKAAAKSQPGKPHERRVALPRSLDVGRAGHGSGQALVIRSFSVHSAPSTSLARRACVRRSACSKAVQTVDEWVASLGSTGRPSSMAR